MVRDEGSRSQLLAQEGSALLVLISALPKVSWALGSLLPPSNSAVAMANTLRDNGTDAQG